MHLTLSACDPLLQQPRIPLINATIVAPADGSRIVQPGPAFTVVVAAARCDVVGRVEIVVDDVVVAADATPAPDSEGTLRIDVPIATLLQRTAWRLAKDGHAEQTALLARVTCDDFGQSATAEPVKLSVNPAAGLRATVSDVRGIFADRTEPGSVLVVGRNDLQLAGRLDVTTPADSSTATQSREEGGDASFWQLDDEQLLWETCTSCEPGVRGRLYRLRRDPLDLTDSVALGCEPAAVARWPGEGHIVVGHIGCERVPAVTVLDRETLQVRTELGAVGGGFLAQFAARGADQIVGLAHDGQQRASLQLFRLEPGLIAWPLTYDTTVDPWPAPGAIGGHGSWGVWISGEPAALHRVPLDDASATAVVTLPVERAGGEVALNASARGTLALHDDHIFRVYDLETSDLLWQRRFDGDALVATASLPEQGWALLTRSANLLLVDAAGRTVREQGALAVLGAPVGGLVATDDGLLHYALGSDDRSWLVSFGSSL